MELTNTLNFPKNPFRFFHMRDIPIPHHGRLYHMHQGMELFYVHQGTYKALIENKIMDIHPGMLLYFSPFQLHGISMDPNQPQMLIRSIFEFDPVAMEHYVKLFPSLQSFFYNLWKKQPNRLMIYDFSADERELAHIEHQLFRLSASRDTKDYEEQYVLTVFSLLKSIQSVWMESFYVSGMNTRPQTTAELVMEWIEQHFQEPFSMEALSKTLHLSEKHISTLFKNATGTSITQYLMAMRLKHACRLLINTNEPIENIAYEVGLSNFSYFCQFFKTHIGITPLHFRKQLQTEKT